MFDYIRDTKAEFKHVKWPTRREAIAYAVIVILFSVATAVVLGAFDFAFSKIIKLFI
ncbi:MAG: preprotein translocase subunit SecE [Candidatus Pacebacteria bacterium]|jgi:preprotein translocase subunit SecE|nr:preprotein translocase subunit SecE [Candidatus Paceibacterota bacterium]